MPATRARFPKCGHRGFGASCARCRQADRLDERATSEANAGRGKAAAVLQAEALRLRGPQMRGKRRPPVVMVQAEPDAGLGGVHLR